MTTETLNTKEVHELYELACELRNALHGYESLYKDPTVRTTINEFDDFLLNHGLLD